MDQEQLTLMEANDHWKNATRVNVDDQSLRPTARDPNLQAVVETTMGKWLQPTATLLDVGCGDEVSTLFFAKRVHHVMGIDFIDDYIDNAQKNAAALKIANANFEIGNVLDLKRLREKRATFDIVITIRCLINLVSWSIQTKALEEIAACVKPGGLYMTSEGWQEGLDSLNLRRQRIGLPAIEVAKYNRMIPRARFEEEARKYLELVDYISIGLYLFLSRVVHPCYVAPDAPQHQHPFNKVAAELQIQSVFGDEFFDCDYAGIYIFRRLG